MAAQRRSAAQQPNACASVELPWPRRRPTPGACGSWPASFLPAACDEHATGTAETGMAAPGMRRSLSSLHVVCRRLGIRHRQLHAVTRARLASAALAHLLWWAGGRGSMGRLHDFQHTCHSGAAAWRGGAAGMQQHLAARLEAVDESAVCRCVLDHPCVLDSSNRSARV